MNTEIIESTQCVNIDNLVTDGLQVRLKLDEKAISDYAQDMEQGDEFPAVIVFHDAHDSATSGYYLADGFHRIEAARQIGRKEILAEIHTGDYDAALSFALKANTTHGVRRTNKDKRNAMRIAWENREKLFGNKLPTVRQFTEITAVSEGNAYDFLKSKGLFKLNNGNHRAPSVLPSEGNTTTETSASATTVTREHLEERNPDVRAQLKEGVDRFGMRIPERILHAFQSREPQKMMRELGTIRKNLEKAYLDGDPAFAAIGQDGIIALDNAIRRFRFGFAWCVCRACRGDGCASCGKRGFQTKFQYDRLPSEYKAGK